MNCNENIEELKKYIRMNSNNPDKVKEELILEKCQRHCNCHQKKV